MLNCLVGAGVSVGRVGPAGSAWVLGPKWELGWEQVPRRCAEWWKGDTRSPETKETPWLNGLVNRKEEEKSGTHRNGVEYKVALSGGPDGWCMMRKPGICPLTARWDRILTGVIRTLESLPCHSLRLQGCQKALQFASTSLRMICVPMVPWHCGCLVIRPRRPYPPVASSPIESGA